MWVAVQLMCMCCRRCDGRSWGALQDLKWKATDYEPIVQRHVLYWAEEKRSEEVADQIYEVRKGLRRELLYPSSLCSRLTYHFCGAMLLDGVTGLACHNHHAAGTTLIIENGFSIQLVRVSIIYLLCCCAAHREGALHEGGI